MNAPVSTESIAERLMQEFGYQPSAAQHLALRLPTLDPILQAPFWNWWHTGALDANLEVEGYTIERLLHEHQLNPVAAFSTLDGLKTNPTMTLDTLRRGFDRHSRPVPRDS